MPSHIKFAVALLLVVTVVVRSAEETCRDQATCEDFPGSEAEKASAMLQVMSKIEPQERVSLVQEGLNILQWQSAHLKEARDCMPHSLGEFHLQSIRHNAAGSSSPQAKLARQLASGKAKPPPSLEGLTLAPVTEAPVTEAPATEAPVTEPPATEAPVTEAPITKAPATEAPATKAPATKAPVTEPPATEAPVTEAPITEAPATKAPATKAPVTKAPVTEAPATEAPVTEAPMTEAPATEAPVAPVAPGLERAAEFKATTSLCCPVKMEIFFNSLLDSLGFDVCSMPHIQGLMHWFTCVPDMDFQYMLDVIQNGNPCKYWAPKGEACPALSDKCAGRWCR